MNEDSVRRADGNSDGIAELIQRTLVFTFSLPNIAIREITKIADPIQYLLVGNDLILAPLGLLWIYSGSRISA